MKKAILKVTIVPLFLGLFLAGCENGIEKGDVQNQNLNVQTQDSVVVKDESLGRSETDQDTFDNTPITRDETPDNVPTNGNYQGYGQYGRDQAIAYFGDKMNNFIVVVDIENMEVIDIIVTGHEKTYAAEIIKTRANHGMENPKMYVDNRGSNIIDVIDSSINVIVKSIELPFHPRSIDVEKMTGLVAVSGVDKPMTAIIDSTTDELIATVGENSVTYPTTSGHSYISSGTMASGHPHWLNENHFVLIDRQHKKIATYKIEKDNSGMWQTTKVNEIKTPSPVHNLIPPEIHGRHGTKHHTRHGIQTSTIFYATAEGANGVYPSVLKLEFLEGIGLSIIENLEIKKEGLSTEVMGVHHLNFLKDQKTIYVGSDEGNLFVVDYTTSPMTIVKTVHAGKGAGHTDEMKHNNIAVVINHKDSFITVMNTLTHEKIADIEVSKLSKDELGTVQTQSHPQYHFSKDGRYFYMFLTEEGSLVKVDLSAKKVVQRLEIGGKLAMGSFVVSHGQHDSGRRDSGQHDSGQRDSDQRDADQRDSGRRDSGRRDSGRRDSGQRDSGQRDSGRRDSGRRGRGHSQRGHGRSRRG
ncbi:MAG: hypothetical protein LGB68_04210 [Sulfurovum sp.]|nr:hypothetical protein [Sulfurovum sp.]